MEICVKWQRFDRCLRLPLCHLDITIGGIYMKDVPIWEKANLTLEEAAAYSGIGTGKLREITNDRNCNFVLWVGNKRLIKKRLFDKFIEQVFSI